VRLRRAVELPVGHIQVDLSAVDYIDSHGVEVLRAARALAAERAITLEFEPPPPSVRRRLATRGLDDLGR
jgi:anti-anti-sigma regulatory factor